MTPEDNLAISRDQLQEQLINAAIASLDRGANCLVSAPTGFGKTRVFTKIASHIIGKSPSNAVLVVQDRLKIANQNRDAMARLSIDATLCTEGNIDQSGQVVFGTAKTLSQNKGLLKNYALLVIDECHHAAEGDGREHSAIIEAAKARNPNLRILATSATTQRADGRALHPDIESADLHRVTYREALTCESIVPAQTTVIPIAGMSGRTPQDIVLAHMNARNPGQISAGAAKQIRADRAEDFEARCVRHWAREAAAEPTFWFTDTISDSEKLVAALAEQGHRAALVHSGLSKQAIEDAFDDFRNGKVNSLVSVDMLTEGVDETRTTVIANLKATTTSTELIQMVGRGMRAHDGKTVCRHLDFGGSTTLHGSIEKLTEVEAFAMRGASATAWRPWKHLQKDPRVLVMHDGDRALFFMKEAGAQDYRVFERLTPAGVNRTNMARVVPYKDMPRASATQILNLTRRIVGARPTYFAALEQPSILSRSGIETTRSLRLNQQHFEDALGALMAYAGKGAGYDQLGAQAGQVAGAARQPRRDTGRER